MSARRKYLLTLAWLLANLFPVTTAFAVKPMYSGLALVAGLGTPGYQDGKFTVARFNGPLGLAISSDGTRLFVADTGNQRIRLIRLDQDNVVSTLAGTGLAGKSDGSFQTASFDRPQVLLYLPGERLLIHDAGNHCLRMMDLTNQTVTTVASGATPVEQALWDDLRYMVYLPEADSVFISFPEHCAVKRLDLKTMALSDVFEKRPEVPHPSALAVFKGQLYVSNTYDLYEIYRIDMKEGEPARLSQVAKASELIVALVGSGDRLYALHYGVGEWFERVLPDVAGMTIISPAGDVIPSRMVPGLAPNTHVQQPACLVVDPLDMRKLYFTSNVSNMISSYRDLSGFPCTSEGWNSNGVAEPDYPAIKPPHTFRTLVVGDSRSIMVVGYPFEPSWNRQMLGRQECIPHPLGLCKRMEMGLNTWAALDEQPNHFEVFNLAHSAAVPLFLWPAFGEVENAIKKNDLDLVVLMVPPTCSDVFPFKFYYVRPLTKEGIPDIKVDSEYLAQSPLKRIPEGFPRRFYDLCKAKKLVKIKGSNFLFDDGVLKEPTVRDTLVEMYGTPFDLLNRRIALMRNSAGQPVRMVLCSMHSGMVQNRPEEREIWKAVCDRYHIEFMDLNDDMYALQPSFFVLDEFGSNQHFNPDGHAFFATVLSHALIKKGFLPWVR